MLPTMPVKHKSKDTASSQLAPAGATLPPAKWARDDQLQFDTEYAFGKTFISILCI